MDEKVIKWLNNNQLACDIWNKKYRHDNETFDEWLDRVSGGNTVIRQMILDKFLKQHKGFIEVIRLYEVKVKGYDSDENREKAYLSLNNMMISEA